MAWIGAASLLALVVAATPAQAQSRGTVVVAGPAAVMESPRGDSRILAEVKPGTVVRLLDSWEDWYFVGAPEGTDAEWQHGWVYRDALQLPGTRRKPGRGDGRLMIRGFGQAGGLMFSASDSFQTILGKSVSTVYGAGVQIVLPNGVFVQGGMDRMRATGTRALVSGEQIFTLPIPNRLTLTPMQVTAGYRSVKSARLASYFGGGVGWHELQEDSPSIPGSSGSSSRHIGYHVLGGAEMPLLRWFGIAGEVQWATVPKALGESGLSAYYEEKDLGGTTFRVKLMIGY
jgi:hypothetical protein